MLRKIFAKASGKSEQQVMNDQLRKAAISGDLPRVKKLVQEGAEVDYKDVNGLTPLYFAVGQDHLAVARFLLEHGADANVAREDSLGPPLVQAAYNNQTAMLSLLLEHGADIDTINYSQRTALHQACWHNRVEAALFLLEKGANPNTTDRMGSTPLRDTAGVERRDVALKLAESGADGDIEYKYGHSIHEKAAQRGWADVVQALDDYKVKAAREAAAEKAVLDKNLAAADVLQNDIAVKKPLIIKPKTP